MTRKNSGGGPARSRTRPVKRDCSGFQDSPRGYQCACPPGFVGRRCELRRNGCSGAPCRNGGRCHALPGGFVCECPPGFAGTTCEVTPPNPNPNPGSPAYAASLTSVPPPAGPEAPVQPQPVPERGELPRRPGGRLPLQLPRRLRGENLLGAEGPLQDPPVQR